MTLRRFRDDFGEREFIEEWENDYITINDLSETGIQSLLIWALNRPISQPLVLDVPIPMPEVLSRRIHRSEDLRLLIAPWSTIQMTRGDRLNIIQYIAFQISDGFVPTGPKECDIGYGEPSLFRQLPGWSSR